MIAFGYGISLDVEHLRFAALDQDRTPESRALIEAFTSSPRYFDERSPIDTSEQLDRRFRSGDLQLAIEVPPDFGRDLASGRGPAVANLPGSRVHDEIVAGDAGVRRPTNNAGGLEGGVTNGEDLRITCYMKPISTLMKPLRSVDLRTMTESPATVERSDVCAVPAAAVVGEAMVAFVLADALIEKFGGDSVDELVASWRSATERTAARLHKR